MRNEKLLSEFVKKSSVAIYLMKQIIVSDREDYYYNCLLIRNSFRGGLLED